MNFLNYSQDGMYAAPWNKHQYTLMNWNFSKQVLSLSTKSSPWFSTKYSTEIWGCKKLQLPSSHNLSFSYTHITKHRYAKPSKFCGQDRINESNWHKNICIKKIFVSTFSSLNYISSSSILNITFFQNPYYVILTCPHLL